MEYAHFSEKQKIYTSFVDVLVRQIVGGKIGPPPLRDKELIAKLLKFKKELLVWGDAGTIEAWLRMETQSSNLEQREEGNMTLLLVWDDVLRRLRKDLGKHDWLLNKGSLVALFLKDEERGKLWAAAKEKGRLSGK